MKASDHPHKSDDLESFRQYSIENFTFQTHRSPSLGNIVPHSLGLVQSHYRRRFDRSERSRPRSVSRGLACGGEHGERAKGLNETKGDERTNKPGLSEGLVRIEPFRGEGHDQRNWGRISMEGR